MAKITFVEFNGTKHTIQGVSGESVMQGAVKHSVPGIDADCGGACACATCHVYVDAGWVDKLVAPSEMEKSMLEFAENAAPNSRLTCQIQVTDGLDGLILQLPEREL